MKVPFVRKRIGTAGGAEEHMVQLIILRIQHDLIDLLRQAVQERQKFGKGFRGVIDEFPDQQLRLKIVFSVEIIGHKPFNTSSSFITDGHVIHIPTEDPIHIRIAFFKQTMGGIEV